MAIIPSHGLEVDPLNSGESGGTTGSSSSPSVIDISGSIFEQVYRDSLSSQWATQGSWNLAGSVLVYGSSTHEGASSIFTTLEGFGGFRLVRSVSGGWVTGLDK